ncbi:MAG: 3-isopropylmalate dehydratase large subunit [Chloroflexi bacterium]|nr:3-isopropylmalate dehydratase large subunit [Chloroflexota bacterium]
MANSPSPAYSGKCQLAPFGLLEGAIVKPKTLLEKIWDAHLVHQEEGKPSLLYVDLHLVHEVTSAQAFEGLRLSGRSVRRPDLTIATLDHNVPTTDRGLPIRDEISRKQIEALKSNCEEFGIQLYGMESDRQGIVHVIGPELGYTRPGLVIVCGDSHTSTHGAFGAFAMPVGTSQVEHVLATQCLVQAKLKTMEVLVEGALPAGVTAKDIILGIIGRIGVDGAVGHVIEFAGEAIRALSMEGRMTVCNMSIEAGARVGMIAPDETTFEYVRGRPYAPKGDDWDAAVEVWTALRTDPGAAFDKSVVIDAAELEPYVTWGTNPGMVVPVTGRVPDPASFSSPADRAAAEQALVYMDLEPGTPIQAYYDRQLPQGVMYLWNAPSSAISIINFTYERQLMVFTSATQTFDLPNDWYDAVVYNLAKRLIAKVGCSEARKADIKESATEYLDNALAFDQAVYPIRLKPQRYA